MMKALSRVWAVLGGTNTAERLLRALILTVVLFQAWFYLPALANGAVPPEFQMLEAISWTLALLVPFFPRTLTILVAIVGTYDVVWGTSTFQYGLATFAVLTALPTKRMWRWFIFFAIAVLVPPVFSVAAINSEYAVSVVIEMIGGWIVAIALGVALALTQRRIEHELAESERAARELEQRTLQRQLRFALDAHDTLSHALASEAAILRLMRRLPDLPENGLRLVENASTANHQTQVQLRALLARVENLSAPQSASTTESVGNRF